MKYILLFVLIQVVALILAVIGLAVCAVLAYFGGWTYSINRDMYHWKGGKWTWVWDNQEDGTLAYWYSVANPTWSRQRAMFMWSALRNPVNNLRYVRGVSKVGRPLWRKTWGAKPGGFYAQAGWNHSGFPVLSLGRNFNVY